MKHRNELVITGRAANYSRTITKMDEQSFRLAFHIEIIQWEKNMHKQKYAWVNVPVWIDLDTIENAQELSDNLPPGAHILIEGHLNIYPDPNTRVDPLFRTAVYAEQINFLPEQ